MFWCRKRSDLRNEGINFSTSGRVLLRNAPKNGEYRVVDLYGALCLQSSCDGEAWVYVEIFDNGYRGDGHFEPEKWEILGTQKKSTKETLLNVARQIRNEPFIVVQYLDEKAA